jgi:uncharacterized membrane protein
MPTLIAIGYPDETTASAAADEALRLAPSLVIEPEAIAVISRSRDGVFQVSTNHHAVTGGATWGLFWGLLFGVLFFVPVLGMSVDRQFQDQVRAMVDPGTSALFLVVDTASQDEAVDALGRFGGTVLKSLLSEEQEKELQEALQGQPAEVGP